MMMYLVEMEGEIPFGLIDNRNCMLAQRPPAFTYFSMTIDSSVHCISSFREG